MLFFRTGRLSRAKAKMRLNVFRNSKTAMTCEILLLIENPQEMAMELSRGDLTL